jgi:hypothetical protein
MPAVFLKYCEMAKFIADIEDTDSGPASTNIPADCKNMMTGIFLSAESSIIRMIFAAAAASIAPHSTEKFNIITPNWPSTSRIRPNPE